MKHAVIVRFKRNSKESKYETGVGLVSETASQSLDGLIDAKGHFVVPYDFTILYVLGCMQIPEDSYFEGK